ncbi:MAG: exodeoxyribonuclease III [Myxococcales bacterium]|nr:MAG: exodeoxyribonuclease III [Myxococcales bacterium]
MKIYSWNVNGIRAALKQGFLDWLKQTDPDVLNLQEIRADLAQVDPVARYEIAQRYDVCWFPSTAKKGYSGTATLTRKGLPFVHTPGLGLPEVDAEGRIIISKCPDFTLIAGYFPNGGEGLARLPFKRQFSADLTRIIRERHALGEKLVVVGDLNVAPEEIDLANPATNRRTAGFTDEEREDFRTYLSTGLVDVFRERHPGEKGHYSWWSARGGARSRNVGWRIDIFLVSPPLVERVRDAKIHPDVLGSDHCPVSLDIV